jgi:nucleotide sugar dehydrogenase
MLEDIARAAGRSAPPAGRPVVCVQGLGYVGAAMAVAVAAARDGQGGPRYNVIGVDLPGESGRARIDALNHGRFPFATADDRLVAELARIHQGGNLVACSDAEAYGLASVVVVDIPLDVDWSAAPPALRWDGFRRGIAALARAMSPGSLVILESTVPPGTTARVVAPIFERELAARGLAPDAVHLAHSYERVMPGRDYLDSIVNFWRVYAGHTSEAAEACERFLRSVIHVDRHPLTRVGSTTASELGKVLENAYRATNIAFMEEWSRFAEAVGVDLFEVVDAIRVRPTHSNMRTPGFGVGGYCLTKDPLFGALAARDLFGVEAAFPFSTLAVRTNQHMPRVSVERLEALLDGRLAGRTLLLLGVSYRPDVGDTRYSPSETFVRAAREKGARVIAHDPLVRRWEELELDLPQELPPAAGIDAVVLAVPHREYRELDFEAWLEGRTPVFLDAFSVLSRERRERLRALGCRVESIGRGPRL